MRTPHLIIALALAISIDSIGQSRAASSGLPAPPPDFQSLEQLREKFPVQESATPNAVDGAGSSGNVFFTGKVSDKDASNYLFLFRSYDPELCRWGVNDPSGFPDGLNNRIYAANPVSELDATGLRTSLGRPSLPSPTGWQYGGYESVAGNLFRQTRGRFEYTQWNNLGIGGVGNVGEAVSFAVGASISGTINIGLSAGVSKVVTANATFGASGGIGASGTLRETKPATEDVSWEAKGLIGSGRVAIYSAFFELNDGNYTFAPGYTDYVSPKYSYSGYYNGGLGIEWFE